MLLPAITEWDGNEALTQGCIYASFDVPSEALKRWFGALRERIDLISWRDLANELERIAVAPITAVTFDATNRRAISAEVFERFEPRRTND
jgi:hypothetical protein